MSTAAVSMPAPSASAAAPPSAPPPPNKGPLPSDKPEVPPMTRRQKKRVFERARKRFKMRQADLAAVQANRLTVSQAFDAVGSELGDRSGIPGTPMQEQPVFTAQGRIRRRTPEVQPSGERVEGSVAVPVREHPLGRAQKDGQCDWQY